MADGYVFVADETNEGQDLNADGDLGDSVIHYVDRPTSNVANLGFALHNVFTAHGDRLAFLAYESDNGNVDFNGDGDAIDRVLHVVNVRSGVVTNLHRACPMLASIQMDDDVVAFPVDEFGQGFTDLNGDGDTYDQVLYVFDFATGTLTSTGIANGFRTDFADGVVLFGAFESGQRVDFNGDGDTADVVLHWLDTRTGALRNEGLAISLNAFEVIGGGLEVGVSESDAGQTDLNLDGDAADEVLFVQRVRRGAPVATGWTTASYSHQYFDAPEAGAAERSFLFYVQEADQGATDLNGDGDATDLVLCLGRLR
jgi:hypothetical protein